MLLSGPKPTAQLSHVSLELSQITLHSGSRVTGRIRSSAGNQIVNLSLHLTWLPCWVHSAPAAPLHTALELQNRCGLTSVALRTPLCRPHPWFGSPGQQFRSEQHPPNSMYCKRMIGVEQPHVQRDESRHEVGRRPAASMKTGTGGGQASCWCESATATHWVPHCHSLTSWPLHRVHTSCWLSGGNRNRRTGISGGSKNCKHMVGTGVPVIRKRCSKGSSMLTPTLACSATVHLLPH